MCIMHTIGTYARKCYVMESRNDLEAMPPKLDPDTETKRLNIVAPASWVRRVDEWRRTQPDLPNVSQAIRRLVDAGLEREGRKPKGGGGGKG